VRNEQSWLPSKLVFDARRRRYVPHPKGVSLGSRLAVGAQAEPYEKLLRENARGRMLDCGCGKVPFYEMYRKHVSSLTCIDWNDTGYSDRTVDLSGPLPFEPASFDTVLLSDVLEHIAEPEALMAEIARVLAPKGSLILTVPFLYHVHEAAQAVRRQRARRARAERVRRLPRRVARSAQQGPRQDPAAMPPVPGQCGLDHAHARLCLLA
jgi:SAM-dependent methyltransferase